MTTRVEDLGPKYPQVTVRLTGEDGNAFSIIGRVAKALRREVGPEAAAEFQTEAFAQPSYDHLLRLAMRTVEVE